MIIVNVFFLIKNNYCINSFVIVLYNWVLLVNLVVVIFVLIKFGGNNGFNVLFSKLIKYCFCNDIVLLIKRMLGLNNNRIDVNFVVIFVV